MSQNHQNVEEQAALERQAPNTSKQIYQGRAISIRVDTITTPDGLTYQREIVEHPGAVVMIPVDQAGRILLVRQWRRAAQQILLELPAGTLERGEEPIACAQRELQEEIGYAADKITPLGGFFSAPGFCNEYLHLFLAEELQEKPLAADEDEHIEVVSKTMAEALAMIEQGLICDAKTIAGISRYYLRKEARNI
ncbi:MAG: NUDIX hydrolase [Chloroflexi bacterium]|nr:NUDIX hydrolase [Chloroflexota bacterium]